jgi:hypothetical protein
VIGREVKGSADEKSELRGKVHTNSNVVRSDGLG